MLINNLTNFTLKSPDDVLSLQSHVVESLRESLNKREFRFFIHSEITDNNKKVIYKVGFLRYLYKILYPDMPYSEIYTIINTNWEVFKSDRQMERYASKYIELF